jgi:F0F1-type ATP synthase beta subunit
MDLNHFEKRDQTKEQIIHAEALGESEANFARNEMEKIKHKLDAKKKQQQKLKIIFGTLLSIIVLLTIVAGYSQYKLRTLSLAEKNTGTSVPVITASTTPQDIISILGKHILLPEGDPQIAEVRDVEKLRDQQAFFKNAENGDIIVLYATTIFIYRPSKDIVVASGDVTGLGQTKP